MNKEDLREILKEELKSLKPETPKATMTIQECAKYSGIGKDKLFQLAHSKTHEFPVFRVGCKFLINKEMFDQWLQKISYEKKVI